MFAQAYFPQALGAEELDHYLEMGWFRMNQTIFTTNFLNFNNQLYSAVWLRLTLAQFTDDKRQQKLAKLNSGFTISINKAHISPEKELLYSRYRQSISFEASASLHQLLYGAFFNNIYNTYEVTIHDGNKIIACGFFDIGKKSAAGITSFYDPDYKKHSLGKYLIYQKIKYCKELQLQYFYPGYFVPGYSFFDYKLGIGKPALEFLELTSGKWLPIDSFDPIHVPIDRIRKNLHRLQELLSAVHVRSEILKYEYFDANIMFDSAGSTLFDYPLFLTCLDSTDSVKKPIVYNVINDRFQLMQCSTLWIPGAPENMPGMYSSHLLKTEYCILAMEHAAEMAANVAVQINGEAKIV